MTYPGGKNGSGVYQRIINRMPPHKTYIEGFLGSGAVLRAKLSAQTNIGIDRCSEALKLAKGLANNLAVDWRHDDFFRFIADYEVDADTLIYLDPPYIPETRKAGDIYDFELSTTQHLQLLELVQSLDCMVMISGYPSYVYDEYLAGWNRVEYSTQTRRGMVRECLWMNFPTPERLHDYTHLGDDFRERERIKRKKDRWVSKLKKMKRQERLAILDALNVIEPEVEHGHG